MEFGKFKETKHLKPLTIPHKDRILLDLSDIEHSFTGRIDGNIANTFILEANYMIVNSLNLFEQGFFDCAFYSLRQSLEVAMTMMYLYDSDEDERKEVLSNWRSEKRFPMYSNMAKYLQDHESEFKEIKENLPEFFEETNKVKKRLNKYVHKQGFDKLYASRNHPLVRAKFDDERFTNNFLGYVKQCIGTIAVMRLAIDPMPVLLNDEEIYSRTGDMITFPYSDEFIEKYIGLETIKRYKQTSMYINHFDFFMHEEKKSEVLNSIVKDKFIDVTRADEILEQAHLLSEDEYVAVIAMKHIDSITKFYSAGGFIMYFSNRNTLRTKSEWNSKEFNDFLKAEPSTNNQYDEVYLSAFKLPNSELFFEHNEPLTENDIYNIEHIIKNLKHET